MCVCTTVCKLLSVIISIHRARAVIDHRLSVHHLQLSHIWCLHDHVSDTGDDDNTLLVVLVIVIITVLVVAGTLIALLLVYRKRHRSAVSQTKSPWQLNASDDEGSVSHGMAVFGNVQSVTLERVIIRGRFGVVWQGRCDGQPVAVKIFSEKDRDSWFNECRLYTEGYMQHPSIVR